MTGRRRLLVVVALSALGAPLPSQVTQRANLQFGTVISGTPSSVAPTAPSAGSWQIHFTLLAIASSFALTLPSSLSRVGGGATMPISFCSTCGIYRLNNTNPSGGTVFNPSNTVNLGLLILGSNIYVWLGGTVSPPLNQMPGSYTGSAVLTLFGVTL